MSPPFSQYKWVFSFTAHKFSVILSTIIWNEKLNLSFQKKMLLDNLFFQMKFIPTKLSIYYKYYITLYTQSNAAQGEMEEK